MKIVADLGGQNTPNSKPCKVYGAGSDIVAGALVEPGAATASLGAAVISADPPTNVLGLLTQLHDYSVVGDFTYTDITSNTSAKGDVDIRPFAVYQAELAVCATQEVTVTASTGAGAGEVGLGTTAGAADELGGAYMYNASTDELQYVEDQDAADTAVFATDIGSTDWTAVKPYIVPPIFYGAVANTGLDLNATLDQVILEGTGTGAWCRVLKTYIQQNVRAGLDELEPSVHDNNTYADAKFFVEFVVLKHAFNA